MYSGKLILLLHNYLIFFKVIISFQEVNSKPLQRLLDYFFNDPWTNELTNLLSKQDYVNVSSIRLVGILLNVFVKRSLLSNVRYSINGWIRLGFCGLWVNPISLNLIFFN